jgi:HD superfamily phosphodiesterase
MPGKTGELMIPDTVMACSAREFVCGIETELLFNHSHRVFAFAALSGERHGLPVDPELLYVSALFHRVGLTDAHRRSTDRFEVDGANAARDFLLSHGILDAVVQEVWDAIALHTTPGIGRHKPPLVALVTRGVEVDTLGFHLDDFSQEQKRQMLDAYPREEHFKEKLIEALGSGMRHRPDTTFGTVNADILDRVDPNYRRMNFFGLVLGSEWAD